MPFEPGQSGKYNAAAQPTPPRTSAVATAAPMQIRHGTWRGNGRARTFFSQADYAVCRELRGPKR